MMRISLIILAFTSLLQLTLSGQSKELSYFLGEDKYEQNIPSPEEYLGYQPGDWHISHHELLAYFKTMATASENAQFVEYGRSYENRPLFYLLISSKENLKNIEKIKASHKELCDPEKSASLNTEKMPAVVYEGFTVHGNEASGANATPLLIYHLLASKSKAVDQLLNDLVIIVDPCFNPDGFNRFSSWVNSHKGKNLNGDSQSREYNEAWPRGRTNHYWFDLNRDWLPVQHPESRGRIQNFHEWKPNILTDHHEMGANSTFFFQPGIPQRTNPNTPQMNQDLTGEIGQFHANALDDIGSLYFTKEAFDDYYYGKGSTYPDINGSIGILFEQASSRGHFQNTENGPMDFAFTIKNQLTTALSTLEAAKEMRVKLLDYQRSFYKDAKQMAKEDEHAGYVFSMGKDIARAANFIEMLDRHQIDIYSLSKDLRIDEQDYFQYNSYYIPFEQNQYRLIKAAFEYRTSFKDSIFYDVSAFNLADAFGANFDAVPKKEGNCKGKLISDIGSALQNTEEPEFSDYGYIMEWDQYYAPKALYTILSKGLRAKVANEPFSFDGKKVYSEGSIYIPVSNQEMTADNVYNLISTICQESNVKIKEVYTGLTLDGPDLGSRTFSLLQEPKILILGGDGVSSYDAGEVWHLLDQIYEIPSSIIEIGKLGSADLERYNTIIMPNGSYGAMKGQVKANLDKWATSRDHTLIAYNNALRWLRGAGIASIDFKESFSQQSNKPRPYNMLSRDRGANVIGGAILNIQTDLSNPIMFGYTNSEMPIFRKGGIFLKAPNNAYACPAFYTNSPLRSGYASERNIKLLKNAPSIINCRYNNATVVCFADNPNFRAFWHGTQKLTANAIFFGSTINKSSLE